MANISAAIQAKNEKTLNTLVRYSEGVMTKKEWIKKQFGRGAYVEESTKNRIQYNRIKFNRMSSNNEQEEYMKKCNEMVKCYELRYKDERSFWEISKTEYDYFNSLVLQQDINTQKFDLQERVEANTATDEEIEADANNEMQFFNKYFAN